MLGFSLLRLSNSDTLGERRRKKEKKKKKREFCVYMHDIPSLPLLRMTRITQK